jgi:hypothetical protein
LILTKTENYTTKTGNLQLNNNLKRIFTTKNPEKREYRKREGGVGRVQRY